MALKDWKQPKIRRNFLNKTLMVWKKDNEKLSLEKYQGIWIFYDGIKTRTFKTKTQALQFAKAYMRKH